MDDRAFDCCYDAGPRLDADLLGFDDNPITNLSHGRLQTLGTTAELYPSVRWPGEGSPYAWSGWVRAKYGVSPARPVIHTADTQGPYRGSPPAGDDGYAWLDMQ